MLTKLKRKVQAILKKEAETAHKVGLTPNVISAIGILLAFLSALTYAAWQTQTFLLLTATVLLLLSGFCDALDGAIARLYHETTVFGGFLDSLLDRYADAVVYAGIVIGGLCDLLWGLAALIGSLLVSYSRARAEAAQIEMESVGLAERAERIIILVTATLVGAFWETQIVMNAAMIVIAILSNITVIQRGIHVYNELKS